MEGYQLLYYGGIVLMICAALGAVGSLIAFRISGKRLREQLEKEFGARRH